MRISRNASFAEPYFAVGHSNGGWVSMAMALDKPMLAGVVLINSMIHPPGREQLTEPADMAPEPTRYEHFESALLRRFHVVPDDPWVQPYLLDHVRRHSLSRDADGWTWKMDRTIFSPSESTFKHLLTRSPCRVAVIRGAEG